MQENDFEIKMRQKMDAWQVQPGDDVWQKVKAQVSQRKRRRGLIFFFLFFSLLTAGLLIGNKNDLFTNSNKQISKTDIQDANNSGGSKKEDAAAKVAGNTNEITGNEPADNKNTLPAETTISSADKGLAQVPATEQNAAVDRSRHKEVVLTPAAGQLHRYPVRPNKTNGRTTTHVNAPTPENDDADETGKAAALVSDADKTQTEKNPATVVPGERIKEVAAVEETSKKPEALPNKPLEKEKEKSKTATTTTSNKNKSSKWQLAVSFSGGLSFAGINNGKLFSAASDGLSTPPVTGTPGNQVSYYPSPVKPGFAFVAGLQVSKAINDKIKFTTGLQYQSYSAVQKTGDAANFQSNTPVRTFAYGNTVANRHHYQYLSVPAGIALNIFDIGSKEIWLDAGFNYTRLLKARSLSFDTATGYYKSASSGFNKNQFGLSASLAINLSGKGKAAFCIGPQFQYSFTPLANAGLYSGTHSRYIGIMLRRNLKK